MYKFEMSFAPRANLGQVPGEGLIGNVYMLMLILIPDFCLAGIYQGGMSSEVR